ncbi:MAG: hypothetical protein ACR2PM_09825, partial [Hyphomicrobiales bacterium]
SRIAGLRKKSRDPHVWFDSVEEVVSRDVGLIPVRYVLNIYQYYIAFKNYAVGLEGRREIREQLKKGD